MCLVTRLCDWLEVSLICPIMINVVPRKVSSWRVCCADRTFVPVTAHSQCSFRRTITRLSRYGNLTPTSRPVPLCRVKTSVS